MSYVYCSSVGADLSYVSSIHWAQLCAQCLTQFFLKPYHHDDSTIEPLKLLYLSIRNTVFI